MASKVTVKFFASLEDQKALLAFLEKERDALIESRQGDTPLAKAMWAATDSLTRAIADYSMKRAALPRLK